MSNNRFDPNYSPRKCLLATIDDLLRTGEFRSLSQALDLCGREWWPGYKSYRALLRAGWLRAETTKRGTPARLTITGNGQAVLNTHQWRLL